jgi:hypothetical protein
MPHTAFMHVNAAHILIMGRKKGENFSKFLAVLE